MAHCRNAVTELPRGAVTAAEFLAALPAACRLLLPDITGSGPAMFAVLVSHGLLPAMPSPRVLPAALALAATVSPLLERRSARQWTMWLARVRERDSAVAVAVQARTPDSQRSAIATPVTPRPLRSAALRAERDELAEKLARAQVEAEKYRAELATVQERQVACRRRERLRRGRMLPPNEREVLTVRQDAAREVRQLQSIRPLPWQED